jgi:predicted nuclease of predicted toxin-antitoxin system
MTLVLDECLSDVAADLLGELSDIEVMRIADYVPRAPDATVLALSARSGALLITNDKDFGELVFRAGLHTSGVLLCRTAQLEVDDEAVLIRDAVDSYRTSLVGAFSVLTARNLRIRRLRG